MGESCGWCKRCLLWARPGGVHGVDKIVDDSPSDMVVDGLVYFNKLKNVPMIKKQKISSPA